MNPAQLLAHFHRLAEAPEAIPRLRRFILDLAVRGKLVEQDPKDEPAERLLLLSDSVRKNVAKNDRRADEGRQTILAEEQRWKVPATWQWRGLADLALFIDYRGQTPSKTDSGVRLITAKNVKKGFVSLSPEEFLSDQDYPKWMTRGIPQVGDVLFTTEAPMGNAAVVRISGRFALAQRIINFRLYGNLDPDFLVMQLLSDPFQQVLDKMATGLTAKGIKASKLKCLPISIPPLSEQQRIVAKVHELMSLCDRLEAVQAERERRRARLVASTHAGLATSEPQYASFFIRHFPTLTTHPDQIPQLRQTILNLAVRGKLVEQDPKDEPAERLLQRIQEEKARLVKEGILKKTESASPASLSDCEFELPSAWVAARLQSLCLAVTDGDHLPPPKADRGVPFLVIGNVRDQTIQFAGCRYVAEEYYHSLDDIKRPRSDDLLYTLVGSYGIPVLVRDDRPFCVQRHIGILRPSQTIVVSYLKWALQSQYVFDQATACATGIAQKTVPLAGLRKMIIPLPPLTEQHRIVTRVEELMSLCDRMEAQLRTTQTESRRLLSSVLNAALAPAA